MPFPETPRIIYKRNPLKKVICQLRFPPILRIETSPADFQDRVRNEFPEFVQTSDVFTVRPSPLGSQFPMEMTDHISNLTKSINYEFSSDDGTWKANLKRNFITRHLAGVPWLWAP
jgi:uncharacterized protein (TIGR04255 family)